MEIQTNTPFSFKLLMIRHGKTDANGNTYQGEIDFDLNEIGKGQMETVATSEEIKDTKVKAGAIFRSYMKRAVHSAEIIKKESKLNVIEIKEMREFKIGILQGKTDEAYKAMIKEAKDQGKYDDIEDKHSFVIKSGMVEGKLIEGESVNDVYKRVITSLTEIAKYACTNKDEVELAIVHEWWTRCIIAKKYGIDKDQIKIENGGLILLELKMDELNKENPLAIDIKVDKCTKCFIDGIKLEDWIRSRF
jgi:broad specificity phosphatase PhoE